MTTLHLLCGLPGSGKSTLAKRLEAELAVVRLTPDEWIVRLGRDGHDEAARAAVEALQWELAQKLLSLGVSVVMEAGFWSRSERQALREAAEALGASVALHFLDAPLDELKRRIVARNADLPEFGFPISPDDLDSWVLQFERPEPDELA